MARAYLLALYDRKGASERGFAVADAHLVLARFPPTDAGVREAELVSNAMADQLRLVAKNHPPPAGRESVLAVIDPQGGVQRTQPVRGSRDWAAAAIEMHIGSPAGGMAAFRGTPRAPTAQPFTCWLEAKEPGRELAKKVVSRHATEEKASGAAAGTLERLVNSPGRQPRPGRQIRAVVRDEGGKLIANTAWIAALDRPDQPPRPW